MKRKWIIWMVVLFSSLLLIYGCGKDEKPPQTAQDLINQGWTKFDAGNYTGASADFNAAIGMSADTNDAYLGLGWAELRQDKAGLAEKAFVTYVAKVSDSDDAKAGLALACDAQDKFKDAIDNAEDLLSSNPTWSFSHDSGINYLDVALVLAYVYYYGEADFSQSLTVVKQYFDPNFNPDLGKYEGRVELAEKIYSLFKQVA
jgi:tetratricopeptide (TPR) repeat protein